MKKIIMKVLLALLVFAGVSLTTAYNGADYVSAETNESGTVTVIKSNGQVYKDYSNVRDAWDYCKNNSRCTIMLKTDISTNNELTVVNGMNVTVDLNGHKLNGNGRGAFEVKSKGELRITSSAKDLDGSIVKGQIENCTSVYGGAIRSRGVLEVENVRFYNCYADGGISSDGGAIAVWSYNIFFVTPTDPHARIINCEFENCGAWMGGAVSAKHDDFSAISSAATSSNGGQNANCTIQNCTFDSCTANQGGALWSNMEMVVDGCEIKYCESNNDGGALVVAKQGRVYLCNTNIHNCVAKDQGGGISISDFDGNDRSYLEIYGGAIQYNRSEKGNGGGIDFPDNASLKLGGDLLINNNYYNNNPNNLDMYYKNPLEFFEEGLTDGANVHVTVDKDTETYLGRLQSESVAEDTANCIDVDQMGSNKSDNFDAFPKDKDSTGVYAGRYRTEMAINKFEVVDHPEADVFISNIEDPNSRFIIAQYNMGSGGYRQQWKVWWHGAGVVQSLEMEREGVTSTENPLTSGTEIAVGATSQEDRITIIRRSQMGIRIDGKWKIILKDNPRYTLSSAKCSTTGLSGKTENKYYEDDNVSLTADATVGGENFKCWEVSGVSLTEQEKSNRTISFKMPENDVAAVAIYVTPAAKPTCLITLNGTNKNKDSAVEPKTASVVNSYVVGNTATVTGTNPGGEASSDYEFDHWEVVSGPEGFALNDKQKKSETFELNIPSGSNSTGIVLKAVYVNKYTLYDYSRGTTTPTETKYRKNADVSIKASASKAGKSFQYWEVEGVDLPLSERNKLTLKFKMPGNNVVAYPVYQASVDMPTSLVTLNGTNKNAAKGKNPENANEMNYYANGSTALIKAENPGGIGNNKEYKFDHWEVIAAPEGFTLTDAEKRSTNFEKKLPSSSHIVLKAVYLKRHEATVINGTINGKADTSKLFEGDKLKVKADVITDKHFLFWLADGVELTKEQKQSESFEIAMPAADVKFVPVYEEGVIYPNNLKIVNGKIVKYGAETKFYENSLLNIEADTRAGYTFKQWDAEGIELDDDQLTNPRISINMPDNDAVLTAVYTKNIDTGDNNNLIIYGITLLLSFVGIGVMLFKRFARSGK